MNTKGWMPVHARRRMQVRSEPPIRRFQQCLVGAGVGLCLVAAPAWGQTMAEDGSTMAAGGPTDVEPDPGSAASGGVLMDNGCIGDGSGWSVSGTNGPFGGFTQFQRFTVPAPGWSINAIGIEGHLAFDPNGTGLLARVWPDDGSGTGPDESGVPLTTGLYFLASDPFSCGNWQDEPNSICLAPGDYWFQWDDNDDPDYRASAKNGTSGGPAFSRRNVDMKEFPHGPLALRIFGNERPCVACPADLDGDDTVGILDLLALLAAWGTDPGGPPDFDGDGTVGILDLLTLLANWGPCA